MMETQPITTLLTLADAGANPSLEGVPAEFLKLFLQTLVFLAGAYVMLRKAGAVNGKADDPLHIKSPLETKKAPLYADKLETAASLAALNNRLEKLEQRISDDYSEIVTAGHERAEKLTHEIHAVKDALVEKIDEVLKGVYTRVNENDQRIARLEGRLEVKTRARD